MVMSNRSCDACGRVIETEPGSFALNGRLRKNFGAASLVDARRLSQVGGDDSVSPKNGLQASGPVRVFVNGIDLTEVEIYEEPH